MRYRTARRGRAYEYRYSRGRSHIQEAAAFRELVGEADSIVQKAFFKLSGRSLSYVLHRYEQLNGVLAREYAERTIPLWRDGRRQMSGLVARRLFDLMPPVMPLAKKHEIVAIVWKRFAQSSKQYFYVGPDADRSAAVAAIGSYLGTLPVLYAIPHSLEAQFRWLSDDDVVVRQQLLNHFMDAQRKAAIASADLHIGLMISEMQADVDGRIAKLQHTIFVGNHEIEIRADRSRTGHAFGTPPPSWVCGSSDQRPTSSSGSVVASIIILILIIWGVTAAFNAALP